MPKASWNDVVIADSETTQVVEGNHYFPPDSVNWQYFVRTRYHTVCSWKGISDYYDIVVDGKRYKNGAWKYRLPKAAAKRIPAYVSVPSQVSIA